jgi:lipopolysaccharide export system permease protein
MRIGLSLLDRYVLKTSLVATLVLLFGLTAVLWLTQALKEIDLVTGKGQTILMFLSVTALAIPTLLAGIAPVALFAGTLYTLNKLNSDSELIVMSAAGMRPAKLLKPFLILTFIVSAFVAWMTLSVIPNDYRILRDLITKIRADFVSNIAKEGQFITLDAGITFHYREKRGQTLLGIFFQDGRDQGKTTIYLAERGESVEVDGNAFLLLEKGSVQRQSAGRSETSIITFDSYALNLAALAGDGGEGSGDKVIYKPRERSTQQLLGVDPNEGYYQIQRGRFRAELNNRFSAPLYPLAFMLLAFAALGGPKTTRQGRGLAIQAAILIVSSVRIAGYMAWSASVSSMTATILMYAIPVLACLGAILVIVRGDDVFAPIGDRVTQLIETAMARLPLPRAMRS